MSEAIGKRVRSQWEKYAILLVDKDTNLHKYLDRKYTLRDNIPMESGTRLDTTISY